MHKMPVNNKVLGTTIRQLWPKMVQLGPLKLQMLLFIKLRLQLSNLEFTRPKFNKLQLLKSSMWIKLLPRQFTFNKPRQPRRFMLNQHLKSSTVNQQFKQFMLKQHLKLSTPSQHHKQFTLNQQFRQYTPNQHQ